MKRAALLAGLLVLALIWAGPLLDVYRQSFAAHMLAHMGVVAIAAPLIAVGLQSLHFRPPLRLGFASTPLPRSTGARKDATLTSAFPLPRAGGEVPSRARRSGGASQTFALSIPVIASLVELIVVWGWHAPALRALAERSTVATIAEQASFLAAGLLLWMSCLGRSGEGGAGAFGLLLTSVHMTLLGALLALSPRPLYGLGEVTCLGVTLSAGQDQELGGVLMLLIGAAVYLAGGVALLARLLAAPASAPESGAR